MKTACFSFKFENAKEASIIFKSLQPEVDNKIPKTKVEVSLHEEIIVLNIETDDISSLRAACNSYLRWINTALSVKKTI